MNAADAVPDVVLDRRKPASRLFPRGVRTFRGAASLVERLAYGRNSDPLDWRLVLREARGTCTTKHALLAALAREQGVPARLILCFFEMSGATHPAVAEPLARFGLPSILEAHCMLEVSGSLSDVTGVTTGPEPPALSGFRKLGLGRLQDKQAIHRAAMRGWAGKRGIAASQGLLWAAREACIAALSAEEEGSRFP